jgi:hypothetical protein
MRLLCTTGKSGLGLAIALAAILFTTATTMASSHREAPLIAGSPRLDGTDFYMFNSYEPGRSNFVTIVANYLPFQDPFGGPNYFPLETNGIYEIEIDNVGDGHEHLTFQFQFYQTNRNLSLAIGPPGNQVTNQLPVINDGQITSPNSPSLGVVETYTVKMITGDRRTGTVEYLTNAADGTTVFTKPVDNIGTKSIPNYNAYASNYMYNVIIPGCSVPGRLFVGQRKDPFVVNLGETFDLVNYSNPLGPVNGEQDSLANMNVTSLILEVPKIALTNTSPVIGGWTTSSLFQGTNITQMSRLGCPLVNELVIGLKDKDLWNASSPANDAYFAPYVTNPTLPAILQLLFGSAGVVAPTNFPRADLVEVFLSGVPGLNETGPALAEELRLNTTTPTVSEGQQSDLGVIGGDLAGYPNGRRPGDDVVDISLRVVMGKLLPTNVAPSGQLPFTDGAYVDSTYFPAAWPYINPPLPGSPQSLSLTVNLQQSSAPGGPFANTRASFNPVSGQVTTAPTGGSAGFYRTSSSQPGVSLGSPTVTSSNVVMQLQAQ